MIGSVAEGRQSRAGKRNLALKAPAILGGHAVGTFLAFMVRAAYNLIFDKRCRRKS